MAQAEDFAASDVAINAQIRLISDAIGGLATQIGVEIDHLETVGDRDPGRFTEPSYGLAPTKWETRIGTLANLHRSLSHMQGMLNNWVSPPTLSEEDAEIDLIFSARPGATLQPAD